MALQQFWKSFTSKPHKLLLNPPTHCFNFSLVGTVPFTIYYLLLTAIILSLSCVAFDDKISSFWGMPHKRVSSFLSTIWCVPAWMTITRSEGGSNPLAKTNIRKLLHPRTSTLTERMTKPHSFIYKKENQSSSTSTSTSHQFRLCVAPQSL